MSTCAQGTGYPWVQIDLLDPHYVHIVRTIQSSAPKNITVMISDTEAFRAGAVCAVEVVADSDFADVQSFTCSTVGRYVTVFDRSVASNVIGLCEIDVIGDVHGSCGRERVPTRSAVLSSDDQYIGCYVDVPADRDLASFSLSLGVSASPQVCNEICYENGHRYFGIELDTCYCRGSVFYYTNLTYIFYTSRAR